MIPVRSVSRLFRGPVRVNAAPSELVAPGVAGAPVPPSTVCKHDAPYGVDLAQVCSGKNCWCSFNHEIPYFLRVQL